jgi:hypothetical protein
MDMTRGHHFVPLKPGSTTNVCTECEYVWPANLFMPEDDCPKAAASSEDGAEPVDIYLPGGRYYGRWIQAADHDVTLHCSCGYASDPGQLEAVLDRAADELHRGH